jgi:hypothetical protein
MWGAAPLAARLSLNSAIERYDPPDAVFAIPDVITCREDRSGVGGWHFEGPAMAGLRQAVRAAVAQTRHGFTSLRGSPR